MISVPQGRGKSCRWSIAIVTAFALIQTAQAGYIESYLVLGGNLDFGETNVRPTSYGDQGFVKPYADWLATQNGGIRPNVINLAIPNELSSTFFSGTNPDGWDRGVSNNLNYTDPTKSQNDMFLAKIAAEKTAGHVISHVSLSMGGPDWGYLIRDPSFFNQPFDRQAAQVRQVIDTVRQTYARILGEVRSNLPNAVVLLLDYYNPYVALGRNNPIYLLSVVFQQAYSAMVRDEAALFGAKVVDLYHPFLGHESQYTYIDSFIDRPNDLGYSVIAQQLIAATEAPEPGTLALLGTGVFSLLAFGWRRQSAVRR